MERRKAIAAMALGAGGLIVLPSWAIWWNSREIALDSTIFTPKETLTIRSISDTIIPEGDSPGALTVDVDKFLIRLFEQCYEPETQNNIRLQIANLNQLANSSNGTDFTVCNREVREELLISFEHSEDELQQQFFTLLKSETIRGFSTSQLVMEQYLGYELFPGYYDGCVDVTESSL